MRAAARWLVLIVLGGIAPAVASTEIARASDLPSPFLSGSLEMWTGLEGTRPAWSSYAGFNWAPLGKLSAEGLRVRVAGGYGEYRYVSVIDRQPMSIYGTNAFADLLVGYQIGLGPLTLKAFAGASFDGQILERADGLRRMAASDHGGKVVLEAWYNVSERIWSQLDLSRSRANGVYGGRTRVGYRLYQAWMADLSIGIEAGAFGNDLGDHARAGAFVRYAWFGGELSASAGVTGERPDKGLSLQRLDDPYATLVYLKRF